MRCKIRNQEQTLLHFQAIICKLPITQFNPKAGDNKAMIKSETIDNISIGSPINPGYGVVPSTISGTSELGTTL